MKKIILASASPRRKELMALAGIDFTIQVADVDEVIEDGAMPYDVVKSLAFQKAKAVADSNLDCIVIGADTVVALGDKILGKPKDKKDAVDMLKNLSGKSHKVYTGVAIISGEKISNFYEETDVEFFELADAEIEKYVATGEPMDKAGAYGIQGKGCVLVKKINGDYSNVVGLPISKVYRELGEFYVE